MSGELKRAYICWACGDECFSNWTDEEAIAEYERKFGKKFDPETVAEICDDCYRRMGGYQRNQ